MVCLLKIALLEMRIWVDRVCGASVCLCPLTHDELHRRRPEGGVARVVEVSVTRQLVSLEFLNC
jgi:hypothetical protein